jgi:hypothetical protein
MVVRWTIEADFNHVHLTEVEDGMGMSPASTCILSFNIEILKSSLRFGWEFDPSQTHFVIQILLEDVGWG